MACLNSKFMIGRSSTWLHEPLKHCPRPAEDLDAPTADCLHLDLCSFARIQRCQAREWLQLIDLTGADVAEAALAWCLGTEVQIAGHR